MSTVHQILDNFSTLDMNEFNYIPGSLWRRLAAIIYDGLLLFAIMMIAMALTLPFTGFKGSSEYNPVISLYLLSVIFFFNGWFWTHGGQTLGMRAWRIQLIKTNGEPLNWTLALARFCLSLPFWGYVVLVLMTLSDKVDLAVMSESPRWLLYAIALTWLVIDQLPNNWRDKLGKVCVRYTDKKS